MNPFAVIGGQLLALIVKQAEGKAKPIVETAMQDGYAIVRDIEGFGQNILDKKISIAEGTNLALGQWDRFRIVVNTVIGESEVAAEEQLNAIQGDFAEIIGKGFGSLISII